MTRTLVTAGQGFYAASAGSTIPGNDSNTGLTATSPMTLQGVVNLLLSSYDLAGHGVTIACAASGATPYPALSITSAFTGGGVVNIVGDTTTPANCVIYTATAAGALYLAGPVQLNIAGFSISNSDGNAIFTGLGSYLNITGNMTFGASSFHHLHAETNSTIFLNMGSEGYTISGGGVAHYAAVLNGTLLCGETPTPVVLENTPAFSVAFAQAMDNGVIYTNAHAGYGPVFSGTGCTAGTKRYYGITGGVFETEVVSDPYYPGGTAGVLTTGAVYNA